MSPRRPLVIPPAIPAAGRIAIIAPGSTVRPAAVRSGMAVLQRWGYQPVAGAHLFAHQGDLAGAPAQRADDLRWALCAPDIDGVWVARGGWGSPQILEALDGKALRSRPRWLFGFSDVTALQAVLLQHGIPSFYAPLVAELADSRRTLAGEWKRTLAEPTRRRLLVVGPKKVLVPGVAEGPLVGGCLTLLATLAGTPWQPDLAGGILFLEDVAEAPYRIDRLLWQLRASGMLNQIAGLALGQFTNCRPPAGRPSRTLASILGSHARELGVPALTGIPAGHGSRPRPLPLGFTARLDAGRGELLLEPPGSGAAAP